MSPAQFATYTGSRVLPFAPRGHGYGPGVCKSCGCDSADCRCGCRQCRKEAKELLFTAPSDQRQAPAGGLAAGFFAAGGEKAAAAPATATAFIGGGCCVHVSVEYAPIAATTQSTVLVGVHDPDGTTMAWEKIDPAGTGYQVKENVITTKPGATLTIIAVNATVRARWCEVFSC